MIAANFSTGRPEGPARFFAQRGNEEFNLRPDRRPPD